MKFTPPEWMPRLEWEAFVLMRKKMRHPLTDRACELITRKLANYRTQGYAPGELLDSAVEHGWLSVYVPNGNGRTTPVKATSVGKGPEIGFGCHACKQRFNTPGQRDGHECRGKL